MFFFLVAALRVLATAVLVPVVRACDHRNNDLFPPAFVNSQMVQAVSLGILEPVVSSSIAANAGSFFANFFFFKN